MSLTSNNKLVKLALFVVIVSFGACQQSVAQAADAHTRKAPPARASANVLDNLNTSLQELARKVSPAVVQIEVNGFGPAQEAGRKGVQYLVRQHAIGAGVIVDPDGYIMTNSHVVEGAQRIRVVMSVESNAGDGVKGSVKTRVFEAKLLGVQKMSDLALLKIDAKGLPTLPLRLDPPARVGELVFAIGSPDGLQGSVTLGVVSSAWRQPDPDNPMVYLQTDAPINPGNSGGPLVDSTGAVVGLNTYILSSSGGNEGLGFAIPARIVDFVFQSLKKYGHVRRTEIGVLPQTITPTLADGLGLPQDWGVMIADVLPGGPAEQAGIKPEDVVVAVDGEPVTGLTAFAVGLYLHPPDQGLTVDVRRGQQKLSFSVPALPAQEGMERLAEKADPSKSHIERLGVFGLDLDDQLRTLLPETRLESGVVVIGLAPEVNSMNSGLQVGDIIHAVNRRSIDTVDELRSSMGSLKRGDAVVLQIERERQLQYLSFEVE